MDKKQGIGSHVLVPKHTKLSEKDKKTLFDKYGIIARDLPSITKKDPALASLEVKAGDVIKVERKSITAGNTIFYRGVIDG